MTNLSIIGPTDGERIHFFIIGSDGVQDFRLDHDAGIARLTHDVDEGRTLVSIDEEHLYFQEGPASDILVVGALGQERLHLITLEKGTFSENRKDSLQGHQTLAKALNEGYTMIMAGEGGRIALSRPRDGGTSASSSLVIIHEAAQHTHIYTHANGNATIQRDLSKPDGHVKLATLIKDGHHLKATVHNYLYLIK